MTGRLSRSLQAVMRTALYLAALLLTVTALLGGAGRVKAQAADAFPGLAAGERVYDETGASLTPGQAADLRQRLDRLRADGADVIVYARARRATPSETLAQVEALQQAWVARTGASQDRAAAILINRNPDDPNDARAGIFVGKVFQEGNVPPGEQRDIVSEALIPPLRQGDVYGSLAAGLDRLDSSIRNGPPRSALQQGAARASEPWLPWAEAVVALVGFAAVIVLFQRRATTSQRGPAPTTVRPGPLPPALAGALVSGGAQPSAVPAVLLNLATRGALAIEAESTGGWGRKPTVQVRLLDPSRVRNEIEGAVWSDLQQRARDSVVSSKELQKVSQSSAGVRDVIERQLRAEGWLQPGAGCARAGLLIVGCVAGGLALVTMLAAGSVEGWLALVGSVALIALAVVAFVMYAMFPRLSQAGQEAALGWKAYRAGLKQAAKDETVSLDLDDALPDIVALNLGSDMKQRLEAATASGATLRAFASASGARDVAAMPAGYPWWIAFVSSTPSSASSGAGSVVSGVGAGGGGGAAGST
ncbi:MAG: DUF2207 domain-containing protein [Chloroflexi bacterium]|nr:DUF2207 domain-containing protein [Chloroflexota bacterium]